MIFMISNGLDSTKPDHLASKDMDSVFRSLKNLFDRKHWYNDPIGADLWCDGGTVISETSEGSFSRAWHQYQCLTNSLAKEPLDYQETVDLFVRDASLIPLRDKIAVAICVYVSEHQGISLFESSSASDHWLASAGIVNDTLMRILSPSYRILRKWCDQTGWRLLCTPVF